jgi:uncharacterized protein (PEP-CTERM system associated)
MPFARQRLLPFRSNEVRRRWPGLLLALPLAATAGDWDFTPRLSVEETYTDNVLLRENGAEGDFITTITPGLSLHGAGSRLRSDIDYNLRQLFYMDQTQLDGSNHQLQGDVEAVVIERWLYFHTRSRMSQQNIDNRGRIVRTVRGPEENRQDVLSYEMIPRIDHRFGSWANLLMEYSNQTVERSEGENSSTVGNTRGNFSSSDQESYVIDLSSGSRFERFPLRATAQSREVKFEDGRNQKLESLTGEASYVWNRKFRTTATGGIENNNIRSSQGKADGTFWSVGGAWTPSQRTTVSGNFGDRFFGNTFNVSASHAHRRWLFTFDYKEDVRTSNQYEQDLLLIPLFDQDGLPVFDPVTNSQIFVPLDAPRNTDDVFVERRLSTTIDYTLRRSDIAVSFYEYDREYLASGDTELTQGVSLNVRHRIRPRLTFNFGSAWRRNRFTGEASSGTYYSIFPSLVYDLGPHTSARLEYEYTRNNGSSGAGLGGDRKYVENAVTANLVFHL